MIGSMRIADLRLIAASIALVLVLPSAARAELRQIDVKIFGMD